MLAGRLGEADMRADGEPANRTWRGRPPAGCRTPDSRTGAVLRTTMRNAIRHARRYRDASCRVLLGSYCVDGDAQRPRQRGDSDLLDFDVVHHAVVEGEHGLGAPHGDVPLECPKLPIGEL